eukprot:TRINITY_DN19576_c0_g1_i2.p1 TRINITY_DN19576_c0_g1~~TRINITY_DN19576_c0_g1_i2.p1  ORF type:complete len:260 (-),score=10.00 TRINITY_DN19576_c0_g1_i2:52-831(-)
MCIRDSSGTNIALLQKQMTHNPFKDLHKPYARRFPHWTTFEESAIKSRKHDLAKSKAAAATNSHAQQLPHRRNHQQQQQRNGSSMKSNTSSPNLGQVHGSGGSDNIYNSGHEVGAGSDPRNNRSQGGGVHRQNSTDSAPYHGSQPSSKSSAGQPTNLPRDIHSHNTTQAFSPSALQLPHHIESPSPNQNNNIRHTNGGGRTYRDALTSEKGDDGGLTPSLPTGNNQRRKYPVSYTHLTLPTKRIVFISFASLSLYNISR